ncbi:hypothetical protein V502_03636 [Pseudogymnoascus sp. VKM F-4520 (FW-2644)]|nr:hypothetical protein V502_03636 [Pseudogymnoascus sp. VKM F-4520 (FW-2644)]
MERFLHCFPYKYEKHRPLKILRDDVPRIDVFITCCGEELGIIQDTANAVCALDYPVSKFRVFVLDDGASAALRDTVFSMQSEHPNIHYTTRIKPKVPDYKAGNLNHGLLYSQAIGDPAEFVAGLDADVIADPAWLRSTIPHLLQDPKLAMVGPPQLYYNVPQNDVLNQDAFPPAVLKVRGSMGVSWCQGSGYVARRKAIMEIGGWPTYSLSEDVLCSMLLLGAHWKTSYTHERQQHGLIPDTWMGHIKQRSRWCFGDFKTGLMMRFCLFGKLSAHMTPLQRVGGFMIPALALNAMTLPIFIISLPMLLLSGHPMITYQTPSQLRLLLNLACLMVVSDWVHDLVCSMGNIGYRSYLRWLEAPVWMSPYHFETLVSNFLLPVSLGGRNLGFHPTGSRRDNVKERDPTLNTPFYQRLYNILFGGGVIIHVLYIIFLIFAVQNSARRVLANFPDPAILPAANVMPSSVSMPGDKASGCTILQSQLRSLLTHTFWPPLLWYLYLTSCLVPIRYAIHGQKDRPREELLNRNTKTGVAYPKKEATKTKRSLWSVNVEHHRTILLFYTVTVLWSHSIFAAKRRYPIARSAPVRTSAATPCAPSSRGAMSLLTEATPPVHNKRRGLLRV